MAIAKAVRDHLLVEARHRCTICAEKCFELHHIVEQAEGGGDEAETLIVLCPNCHQHRYHRAKEFTRDQLRLYKQQLKEQNEIEKRLLLNLEELRGRIGVDSADVLERELRAELSEAASQVSNERSPAIASAVETTSRWLGEREALKGGARTAIELEWEIERERAKSAHPKIAIASVDEDGWQKASDFPAAYTLVLKLDRRPYEPWSQIFANEYKTAWYNMKRRTYINGDRIVMVVADSDNLQDHVDFAKELVKRTNDTTERQVWPLLDRKVNEGKQAALREFDAIKSLKAATRNLRI
jgi:hypothetical protein